MTEMDDFVSAIMGQESGGNSRAVNKDSGALGLFQIMPANVTPWAKQYLGMAVTPGQFLNNADLQRRLATAVLTDYVRRWGYRGAASAWYSGNPNLQNSTRSQNGYPSIKSYVDQIVGRMGETPRATQMSYAATDAVKRLAVLDETPEAPKMAEAPETLDVMTDPGGLGMSLSQGAGMVLGTENPEQVGAPKQAGMSVDGTMPDEASQMPGPTVGSLITEPVGETVDSSDPTRTSTQIVPPISSRAPTFGYGATYRGGGKHHGEDWAVPVGTAVHAVMDGTIVSARYEQQIGDSPSFGLAIRVKNADGTYAIYGHLSSIANLKPGQRISANQVLGGSGNTGNSTGPHLHVEFRTELYNINTSFDWMKRYGIGDQYGG